MPGNPKIELHFEMVEGCKKGDQNSFRELYELFKDRVYSTAYRMLGNSEDARDAAQDTFIKVFRNIHHFREDSSLLTWVYRITINTCLDKAKNLKKRENEFPLEHPEDISSAVPSGDTGGLLKSILEKEVHQLPKRCKTVFILYAIEGFKHEEVAEILNISIGTSKSQHFAAKSLLRKKLIPYKEAFVNEM